MSERCQTKFIEYFENNNFMIFTGISIACVAVLYFYKFHFATIVVSYVFGLLACYFCIHSNVLHGYLDSIKWSFLCDDSKIKAEPPKSCAACGSLDCVRHNSTHNSEPWTGLRVHKQLDQAIEDFYNTVLEQFVSTWYNRMTPQPFFVDELRVQLRYASASLLRRAIKINYSQFITERLIPCALRHYTLCSHLPEGVSLLDSKLAIHPAAANRNAELKYLRCITNAIMPYLLKNADVENLVFRVLVRELFAGWVLLLLTDILADPYILNTLILLATGNTNMPPLPETPNHTVEFLDTFARQVDSMYTKRSKMLHMDLEAVLNDPDYLYAFMQFMKTTSQFHLLQFCKDIKSFQLRILNPDLTTEQQVKLFKEAWDLWTTYFDTESPNSVALDPTLVEEMRLLLADGAPNVKKLQTSRSLYEAARQAHLVLEKIMLPKFLHSEEYYKLVIGPRIPVGYHKQMTKKSNEKLKATKHRNSPKPQSLDGQQMDYSSSESDINIDFMDNMNLLNYLAQEDKLREQDLSTCKVVLTQVEARLQPHPRRGSVRVFTVTVHRIDPVRNDASLWTVERTEHDFHLLRSKLIEFHGDVLQHLPLPSRRDNSPMETIRYKYEDFIQRLLQMTLLQSSELLRTFLTEEGEFSMAVQAASLGANNSDLSNIYQSVTHKLRKEKGQHLEGFMSMLLISCDKDRWDQARRDVEVAQEIDEEFELMQNSKSKRRSIRDIHSSIFSNNFNTEPMVMVGGAATHQASVVGFTQCFIYLLLKVVQARSVVVSIVGSVVGAWRGVVDSTINEFLGSGLRRVLSQRRLAHLLRIAHDLVFNRKSSARLDPVQHREAARSQLLNCVSPHLKLLVGSGLEQSIQTAFEIIQEPQLNKQLVYNLLDLCVLELFPELGAIEAETKNQRTES